ncbi:MAG: hypothetical protein ACR2MP_27245 [Streptosporangiaceae bacterium]
MATVDGDASDEDPCTPAPEVNGMPYAKTSLRAEQRALREKMRELGMSHRQIAVEFARRYRLRPRAAWRNAYGWSLTEAAGQLSTYAARTGLDNGATVAMTAAHLCEHENWPGEGHKPAGRRPTPYLLCLLAAVYGCTVHDLLGAADYEHIPAADRLILDKTAPSDGRRPADAVASSTAGRLRRQLSAQLLPPAVTSADVQIPAGLRGEPGSSRGRESAAAGPVLAAVLGQTDSGLRNPQPFDAWHAAGRGAPAGALPVLNPDEMQHIVAALENARRYADSTVAGYFRDQLAAYAVSDGTRGPKETLPLVLAIIAAVDHAAREARPAAQGDLLAVGARSAEFAGWLYRDSAALRMAGYWHDRAVERAQMAGEPALQGYVLLKKSQAAWDERDAPRMLLLARAARQGPWNLPPWVQAEAIQQEARAEAMLGGDVSVIAARLDEARSLLTQAQPGITRVGTTLAAHYGTSLLAMQMAICYCEAGQPAQAVEIYDEYLTADAFSRRDYGYFCALAAIAMASAGRPDDAAALGRESVSIAAATGSARTLTELARLLERLGSWPGRPAVRAFRAELAAGISRAQ